MAHITVANVSAWVDGNKITVPVALDANLEQSVSDQVISAAANSWTTTSWVDQNTTPKLVKDAIAMLYTGWYIQRVYSEDADANAYAMLLITQGNALMASIAAGTTQLTDADPTTSLGADTPSFYPNDASSAAGPDATNPANPVPVNTSDTSLGGPVFSMGQLW